MAGSAESVEQVWLLGRVVTVCWLGGRLCSAGRASALTCTSRSTSSVGSFINSRRQVSQEREALLLRCVHHSTYSVSF